MGATAAAAGIPAIPVLRTLPVEGCLDAAAAQLLVSVPVGSAADPAAESAGDPSARAADLSAALVLVSSLPLAAELRAALARVAGRPLLLPRFDTLRRWAQAAPLPALPSPLPDSERRVLLHAALAARDWFDDGALWGIVDELAALSDELSEAAVRLPDDAAALAAQLARAYALRAGAPLAFEARVVCEMWRALAAAGRPDAPSAYRLRLSALAADASQPLFVLLDGPLAERLLPAEREFLVRYAERQPVVVCAPETRGACATPLAALLAAAWPDATVGQSEGATAGAPFVPDVPPGGGLENSAENGAGNMAGNEAVNKAANRAENLAASRARKNPAGAAAPLADRAAALARAFPQSPLAGRLTLLAAAGREDEAAAAAEQVFAWLADGCRRIALIAEDRLSARRLRALLEREGVLAADETGWTLSTTRAAATVDALFETVAADAWHADVLDLLKSPFVGADLDAGERAAAVCELERALRRQGARAGLPAFRHALAACGGVRAEVLLARLERALVLLGGRPASLPRWLARLTRALAELGAADALAGDAAGAGIVELIAQRQSELAASETVFAFSAFREWLNREFEAASFRDRSIASGVVFLPRHDARLRSFDAALLIGAGAAQLAPAAPGGVFFGPTVRAELGLATRQHAETALCRDLELLLLSVPRVVATWRREENGEAQLLAPELDLLSTLHALAWGDDLQRPSLSLRRERAADAATLPSLPLRAAPTAAAQLPPRLSVSALASLIACPYRFFARHVLALGELDEIGEELEKSDYGALVHRSLERFHAQHPLVSALPPEAALASLGAIVAEVFAPAEADNWLALGWRLRWQSRLATYLDWQRAREAAGWRWQAAETQAARTLPLADGGSVELYGRIDRIDAGPAGASLLDYKTKTASALKKALADDVQLPAYALLAAPQTAVAEAAYVALDDERVLTVASGEGSGDDGADRAGGGDAAPIAAAAEAQRERLVAVWSALRAGAPLPAHGVAAVCRYCEVRGLCRKDHVDAA